MTIFLLSSDIFFGFNLEVDVERFNNNDEIIQYIKNELQSYLLKEKKENIYNKINKDGLHINNTYTECKKKDICFIYHTKK